MPRISRGGLMPAVGGRILPVFGFLAALLPLSLAAQDSDLRALSDQVQRLQRELTDLQRQVYGDAAGGAAVDLGGAGGFASVDANQEVRLQQLETQLRELTGKVEEALFGVRRISERLDKLTADVDFRLRAIEQGGEAPIAQAPAGADAPPGQGVPGAAAGGDGAARDPQTLGVLSPDELAAFQADETSPGQAQNQTAALPTAPRGPRGDTPEDQYDYAFGLLRQANYVEAESALKGFIERYPEHPLAGNAQYWLGETYYVRGDYTSAAVAFAEGYQKYPKGSKAADNLLKLGMSLAEIGQKEDACRAFLELERQFPDAPTNLRDRASRERQRHGCS